MTTTTATHTEHTKGTVQSSLMECFGTVQAVLTAMPDNVVRMPTNAADAFLLVDPALSMIHRQLADARGHNNKLTAFTAHNAPMLEALDTQIAALEEAYAARLTALRGKREEGRTQLKAKKDYKAFEAAPKAVPLVMHRERDDDTTRAERNKRYFWLWAFLFLIEANNKAEFKAPRLNVA